TFTVEPGELVFITGRSGAGKSTLLKLIPAIERPSSGSVLVNGQNVGALKRSAVPYLRRNLGLVFQDQKLLYDRSVYDNVMLPVAFSAHPPREAARLVRAAARIGILNTLVIGIALALPAGGYALVESLRALTGRLTLEPQVSLFLDARAADPDALAARLKRDPRVTAVRFVPREQALKEL